MPILNHYQQLIEQGELQHDEEQVKVVHALQSLFEQVVADTQSQHSTLGIIKRTVLNTAAPKGLYLWGGVGIGKTFLMDVFFNHLPTPHKLRVHFHEFMQSIHDQLTLLHGQKNPLQTVAEKIAEDTHVLCFDEMVVNDVADAMLLGDLLQSLLKKGVCLLATSNIAPDDLYKNGLHRERFIPAIDLIKANTHTVHMTTQVDYRKLVEGETQFYFTPIDNDTQTKLTLLAKRFSQSPLQFNKTLTLHDRDIQTIALSDDALWLDFKAMCDVPRSQKDYLSMVQTYQTIIVSDLPVIGEDQHNLVRAFINMVDVLYDAKTRLILSAQVPITGIYPKGRLSFEFARTQSRLTEMQASDWLDGELA